MIHLSQRYHQAELMDDPGIHFDEFAETLKQLEIVNRLTRGYYPTLKALNYFISQHPDFIPPIRILDIGCGYGDFLRKIDDWAAQNKIAVELIGVDLNPHAKRVCEKVSHPLNPLIYKTINVFDFQPDQPIHIMINSLFTHHLEEHQIIKLLQWMSTNSLWGWFINDLHRHKIPYYFIKKFVKNFDFNRLIKNDAPLSVARGFKRADWESLIHQAGLDRKKIHIEWYWPFRWGICYG